MPHDLLDNSGMVGMRAAGPVSANAVKGDDMEESQVKKGNNVAKEVLSWVKAIVVAVIIALLIQRFIIVNASIPTPSMEETVMTGTRVICSRLSYITKDPERFDIVVFDFPYGEEEQVYFKRIIGLPGEKIEIKGGKVYVNDSETPLNDSFVKEKPLGDYGPFEIPEEHYFMLGDNRNDSYDSKNWPSPYISEDKIMGKAIFSYYPEFKQLNKNPDETE